MKIPQPRKLPSGSWFVRVTINGEVISITKPTEKEAIAEAMALKAGTKKAKKVPATLTLSKAIDHYIERRMNIISPSTIRGYRGIQNQRFQAYMKTDLSRMTKEKWQRAVNQEAKLCSPKTLKNAWGFIASVLQEETGERYTVALPQKIDRPMGFLDHDQIPKFMAAIKGDIAEIPALLALSSLRQSEILGLRWESVDFENGVIRIVETAVRSEDGSLVHKPTTKNSKSRRTIPMMQPLREALERADQTTEYVVNIRETAIRRHYKLACEKAGVPYVRAHGLRHSFASLACYLGMNEETTMAIGGWADYGTMKKIYTHVSDADLIKDSGRMLNFYSKPEQEDEQSNQEAAL